MNNIKTYIYEKLQINKGKNFESEVNPINVIRNTFINHAKDLWGNASGFNKDEIKIKSISKNTIEVNTYRFIERSDLDNIATEIIEYLKLLDCSKYTYEIPKIINDPDKPNLIFHEI